MAKPPPPNKKTPPPAALPPSTGRRPRDYSRWRAATLAAVYLLMAIHVVHWKISGRTLAPLELNEVMYTLELGIVTAGFLFMAAAVLATLIFGRFFCSWGCHILALEDLAAWILAKLRIRPKPVRSRTLLWVPILAMLYMFAWPQFDRLLSNQEMPALHLRTDAQGWASFVTNDFWRNLPGPAIAIFTFIVCGFVIVYVLGSRGFCTYACPYGAVFSLADRLAPGRIIATADCSGCGICTAACQSRVRVHEEAVEFGRIVNPGCLKDLDCVAACPNGALTYGFALPAIFEKSKSARLPRKPYDFTLAEDLLIAATFVASLFIYRGLYGSMPFLLTLAIGGILGYVAVLTRRLFHRRHVKINNFQLRIDARLTRAGFAFCILASSLLALSVHSAFIRFHEFMGHRLYSQVQSQSDASTLPPLQALAHLETCSRWGLYRHPALLLRIAELHATLGQRFAEQSQFESAIDHFRTAGRQNPDSAFVHYNLGVLLAHTERPEEALVEYRRAAEIDPADPDTQNNLGLLLAQQGDLEAAEAHLRRAIAIKPDFAHPHFNIARVLQVCGRPAEAMPHFRQAARLDPRYRELLENNANLKEQP